MWEGHSQCGLSDRHGPLPSSGPEFRFHGHESRNVSRLPVVCHLGSDGGSKLSVDLLNGRSAFHKRLESSTRSRLHKTPEPPGPGPRPHCPAFTHMHDLAITENPPMLMLVHASRLPGCP